MDNSIDLVNIIGVVSSTIISLVTIYATYRFLKMQLNQELKNQLQLEKIKIDLEEIDITIQQLDEFESIFDSVYRSTLHYNKQTLTGFLIDKDIYEQSIMTEFQDVFMVFMRGTNIDKNRAIEDLKISMNILFSNSYILENKLVFNSEKWDEYLGKLMKDHEFIFNSGVLLLETKDYNEKIDIILKIIGYDAKIEESYKDIIFEIEVIKRKLMRYKKELSDIKNWDKD